tara:strand:- start:2259 stop:2840 length:582 start_codon:yes stop_codon:yes gene_type:complete
MDYLKTWLTFNKSNESINESRIESNESINKSNEEITQLETPIETLIQRVVDEFVNIDNISACLLSSIITHELLSHYGIENQIVNGFKLLNQNTYATSHFWISSNGNNYDVCDLINRQVFHNNGLQIPKRFFDSTLVLYLPPNVERIDIGTEDEIVAHNELQTAFNLYLENAESFWSEIPVTFHELKNNIMNPK